MALGRKQITFVNKYDISGLNVAANRDVTITLKGGGTATVYSDSAGTTPITSPQTDSNGVIDFYAHPGFYTVSVGTLSEDIEVEDPSIIEIATTQELINLNISDVTGKVVRTLGYSSVGDGGGEEWMHTGATGLTPSQSPADYGSENLTDASGNGWVIVGRDRPVSIKAFGVVADGTTDDTLALQAAVNYSVNNAAEIWWPDQTVNTTASIANFHDAIHRGKGILKRGSDLFYISPKSSETNTLYVATTGSDTNDGLSSSEPLKGGSKLRSILRSYGPKLKGSWVIEYAAGTYNNDDGAINLSNIDVDQSLTIKGPSVGGTPNVPTAIVDGTVSTLNSGFITENNTGKITIQDIKTQNFTDSGVDCTRSRIDFINYHSDSCTRGIYAKDHTFYRLAGGKISNASKGIHELYNVIRNWLFNTVSLADGVEISGCTHGLFAKEGCQGHADYATLDNNTYGVYLTRQCGANLSDSQITNNDYGVVCGSSCAAVLNDVDFGIGTANENTSANWLFLGGSNLIGQQGTGNNENTVIDPQPGMDERQIGYYAGLATHTGTTTETTVLTLGETRGGGLALEGQYVRVRCNGYKSGSAGTATLRLELQGSNMVNLVLPADTTNFSAEFWINVIDWTNQTCFAEARCQSSTSSVVFGRGTRTIDFNETTNRTIQLNVELADAADTVNFVTAQAYTNDR